MFFFATFRLLELQLEKCCQFTPFSAKKISKFSPKLPQNGGCDSAEISGAFASHAKGGRMDVVFIGPLGRHKTSLVLRERRGEGETEQRWNRMKQEKSVDFHTAMVSG